MIGRALNSSNDLIIENGSFKLVSDAAEVIQHVRTRLLFYMAEWFLDTNAGVPWLQQIFIRPTNLGNIESILKQTILQTPGILLLSEFEMDYIGGNDRLLHVIFSAETEFGQINREEVTVNA
jgi:hypothetical protein